MRHGKEQERSSASTAVVDLTPEEVLHLAKPKEGFAEYLEPLVELYVSHGGSMPGFDADTVLAELQAYAELVTQVETQQAELALVMKTRALHASNAWRGGLQIYKWALIAGANNPEIKRGISRFEHFMMRARKKQVAPANGSATSTETTTPATTPSGTPGNGSGSSS
jgi:hypothetical protein